MFVTQILFPHIFVWGSCFWLCTSARPRLAPPGPASPPPPAYSHTHTTCTHTHTTCHHTTYSHTTCSHTCPHTTCSHMLTHNLTTHNLTTYNLLTHTTWPHTTCSHNHNLLTHNLFTHNLHTVAGVALGDIDLHFAWQAWHLATWTCILRGRRNTYRTGLALMARLGPSWRRGRRPCLRGRRGTCGERHWPSLCVAGVALGDIDLHFAWQAWHLATWTCILRGRRNTYRTGLALIAAWVPVGAVDAAPVCVAGVALGERHWPSLCVAGVALGDIDLHFAWQAWNLWHWATKVLRCQGALGALPPRRAQRVVCSPGGDQREIIRIEYGSLGH